jgi:hypothetical protein
VNSKHAGQQSKKNTHTQKESIGWPPECRVDEKVTCAAHAAVSSFKARAAKRNSRAEAAARRKFRLVRNSSSCFTRYVNVHCSQVKSFQNAVWGRCRSRGSTRAGGNTRERLTGACGRKLPLARGPLRGTNVTAQHQAKGMPGDTHTFVTISIALALVSGNVPLSPRKARI